MNISRGHLTDALNCVIQLCFVFMRLCVHLSMNRSKPTPLIFTMPNKENNQPWFVISQCRGAVVITTQSHLQRETVITGVAMQLQRCFSVYSECEWMTQPLIKNHLSGDLGNHLRWTFLILTVHLYFLQNKRLNTRTHIKVRDCFATSSQFCSVLIPGLEWFRMIETNWRKLNWI